MIKLKPMATWQFELTAIEITGTDNNGWPLVKLVHPSMQIEETNIIRLYHTAGDIASDTFPQYHSIRINSVDRVDKKTGKDYGVWGGDASELSIRLDDSQQNTLREIQESIMSKALGDSSIREANPLSFDYNDAVKYISEEVACFHNPWDQGYGKFSITSHEEAQQHIDALQRFYSRISPTELAVLSLGTRISSLSLDELETIRSLNVPIES